MATYGANSGQKVIEHIGQPFKIILSKEGLKSVPALPWDPNIRNGNDGYAPDFDFKNLEKFLEKSKNALVKVKVELIICSLYNVQ